MKYFITIKLPLGTCLFCNIKWKEQEAKLDMHSTPNFVRTEQIERKNKLIKREDYRIIYQNH